MSAPTRRSEFWAGLRATLPMSMGAMPFGVIFGALAINSGLSPGAALSLSLVVFAGSSQFIATGLVAGGAGAAIIIFTTLIVNLRHALYSATLAPYMKHLSQRWLLPLGFWLTDETFLIVVSRYGQPDDSPYKHWYHLGSSVLMYVNWQAYTLIGIVAGQRIPDMTAWGLDFAMTATFVGMMVPLLKTRPLWLAAVTAGGSAVLLNGLPNQMGLLMAALLGIAAGVLGDWLWPEPQPARAAAPSGEPATEAIP